MVIITMVWVSLGHIDEVAVATGKVIPSGYTKTIQAFDTGVIKNIHVQDGSHVKAGDVLIELDTTFTSADLAHQLQEQAYYQLEIDRLLAEQRGTAFVPDPHSSAKPEDIQYQLELYSSRMAEYQAKVATAQQEINQAQSALDAAVATKEKLAQQLEIADEEEVKTKELMDQGAVSLFQYLSYKEKRITDQQDLATQVSTIERGNYALLQSMESLNDIVSGQQKDIMTQMVDDRHQLQAIEDDLRKAQEMNRLSTISSPIAGTVHELAVHTVGGVVTPAQTLMLIVPDNDNFQKYGTLDATVIEVSRDAVEDKDKGLVFRALLRLNQNHFDLADGRTVYISPGMAVSAEIKTRQKRIIEFFLDPFVKYRSEGLRER